ncbi:MAG: hypothetical protein ACLTYN_10435 [Dysosmobacter welbionis]
MGVTGLTYLTEEEAEAAKAEAAFHGRHHFRSGHCHGGYRRRQCQLWFVDQVLQDLRGSGGPVRHHRKRALNRIYNSGYNIYRWTKIQELRVSTRTGESEQPHLCQRTAPSGITIISTPPTSWPGGRYGQVRKPAVELCNGYPAAGFLHKPRRLVPRRWMRGQSLRQPPTATRSAC